jgi:hypothetical protein
MRGWTWLESRGVTSRNTAAADAEPKAAATRLSSGMPRSSRPRGRAVWRCFLADVLDGCFFLMCVWQNTSSDWWLRFGHASAYSGSFRSVCSAIGGLAELVGVACWQSRLLELRNGRFAGAIELASARQSAALLLENGAVQYADVPRYCLSSLNIQQASTKEWSDSLEQHGMLSPNKKAEVDLLSNMVTEFCWLHIGLFLAWNGNHKHRFHCWCTAQTAMSI